jgi:hypothetical protein
MSRGIQILGLLAFCLMASHLHAGEVEDALEAFHNTCLAQGPDFDRTAAAAKRLGWTPLSNDAAATLAPIEDVDHFQGGLASGNGLPVGATVGVARGKVNGKAVQTCTFALPGLDYVAFEKSFFTRTDAEKD